jgi:Ca2+-transporting ATPase
MFSARMIGAAVGQGVVVLVATAAIYTYALLGLGLDAPHVRSLTFVALVFGNLGLILTNLSWGEPVWRTLRRGNPTLAWVMGGALAFLALVVYVPAAAGLFQLAPLEPFELALALAAGLAGLAWFEAVKALGIARGRGAA